MRRVVRQHLTWLALVATVTSPGCQSKQRPGAKGTDTPKPTKGQAMKAAPKPAAPRRRAETVAERIRAVETGLLPGAIVEGHRLRWTVEARLKHYGVPAASVAVINEGKVEWAKGYGRLEQGGTARVDARTLFQAASISKPVTAAAVLRLMQAGRLGLDVDVNRYLKGWKVPAARQKKDPITLRKLLSHTSGLNAPEQLLYGTIFQPYPPGQPLPTAVQMLNGKAPARQIPVAPLAGWKGGFRYSGGGYTVVQQLLTDATGKTFDNLLHAEVFKPARMERSTFAMPLPKPLQHNAARAHDRAGRPLPGGWSWIPGQALGGLWTTPTDLARFCAELIAATRGRTGRLLEPKTVAQMLAPLASARPVVAGTIGLGLFVSKAAGETYFLHNGHNPGFHTTMVAWPAKGKGLVLFLNKEGSGALLGEILRAIATVYRWPESSGMLPRRYKSVRLSPATLKKYVGTYQLTAGFFRQLKVRITLQAGALHADAGHASSARLHAVGKTRFLDVQRAAKLTFAVDNAGKVGLTYRHRQRWTGSRVAPKP